ncbi:MAG: NnrU family protein [Proteobacteria bacterium]|jgi:uncharacterized membrane protein|nr:NnrU family protein [Pseudomonadota bacterium]MDA1237378.1 NnrU family protein [Pseudomonadota bacterium]
MGLLIVGLLIWIFAHLFKRVFPDLRLRTQDRHEKFAKVFLSLLIIIATVLIVIGYRHAPNVIIYDPPTFLKHLTPMFMLVAVYIFGLSLVKRNKVWLATKIGHPQLTSVKIWALGHLCANGDLASLLLFSAFLVWAIISVIFINRSEENLKTTERVYAKYEIIYALKAAILFGLAVWVHTFLGVNPFG